MDSKFCWTCGDEKDPRDFPVDPAQYDGLSAECKRCAECRAIARRIDGDTGPRTYAIEGEGRKGAPLALGADRTTLALNSQLRRRPRSGLVSAEGV